MESPLISKTIAMIGITVFSDRMIIFSALKHFLKHSAHDQVIEVACDDAELSQ